MVDWSRKLLYFNHCLNCSYGYVSRTTIPKKDDEKVEDEKVKAKATGKKIAWDRTLTGEDYLEDGDCVFIFNMKSYILSSTIEAQDHQSQFQFAETLCQQLPPELQEYQLFIQVLHRLSYGAARTLKLLRKYMCPSTFFFHNTKFLSALFIQ